MAAGNWFLRSWRRWVVGGVLLAGATAGQLPPDDAAMIRSLVQGARNFYTATRPEKAYLSLDKSLYTVGETIWLSAYVVAADTHRPDTLSRVLHVELLGNGGRVAMRRELRLEAGRGYGDLQLPDTLRPGTYNLRAYTGWMRNAGPTFFFSRRLQIWPPAPREAQGQGADALRS